MGRRAIATYHAFTSTTRLNPLWDDGRKQGETFCGHWDSNYYGAYRHPILDATCRDCAKKYGKAERAKIEHRITVEKLDTPSLKSGVIVSVDGVKRAIVYMRKGFATNWRVMKYRERSIADSMYYGAVGRGEMDGNIYRTKEEMAVDLPVGVYNIHMAAMDAMISIVPALTDAGMLPTIEEEKAADEARKIERQRADEARERAIQQNREERQHAREAVASIAEKASALGLTNFEIAGLLVAKRML